MFVLDMCKEGSGEEMLEVIKMKCLKGGRPLVLMEFWLYNLFMEAVCTGDVDMVLISCMGVEVLAEMNVAVRNECCPVDWRRSSLIPTHMDGGRTMYELVGTSDGINLF